MDKGGSNALERGRKHMGRISSEIEFLDPASEQQDENERKSMDIPWQRTGLDTRRNVYEVMRCFLETTKPLPSASPR